MGLIQSVEPGAVGLDQGRLSRIDAHFARYVDDGRLPGWQLLVTRRGEVAHVSAYGMADIEASRPVQDDTLWRIYSMTKPITSVVAMMLWEEGRFELTDEISRWLPEFADVRVFANGSATRPVTVPAIEPIRIWHLLTHTAGLTYGFAHTSVVDTLYRNAGYDMGVPAGVDLAAACRGFAALPLLYQPGSAWGYSVATDVLGRLIELVAGQPLDQVIADRVLTPLGMADTRWWVEPAEADRLAALYVPSPVDGRAMRFDALGAAFLRPPTCLAGGGGLVSSAADYHRFTQLLLGQGERDGVRLLGPRTVRFMTRNHLPGGLDLASLTTGGFSETTAEGAGFGLGFGVVVDAVPSRVPTSEGSFYWGGAASTYFWVDPVEQLTCIFLTQLVPSSHYPLRPQLRQLVYSSIVDS